MAVTFELHHEKMNELLTTILSIIIVCICKPSVPMTESLLTYLLGKFTDIR